MSKNTTVFSIKLTFFLPYLSNSVNISIIRDGLNLPPKTHQTCSRAFKALGRTKKPAAAVSSFLTQPLMHLQTDMCQLLKYNFAYIFADYVFSSIIFFLHCLLIRISNPCLSRTVSTPDVLAFTDLLLIFPSNFNFVSVTQSMNYSP